MVDLIERIISADNLYWAWSKAKRAFSYGDTWVDLRSLALFEGDLNNELKSIAEDIKNKNYKISPLRPILYPKRQKTSKRDNSEKTKELRQWFYISVRDQVAWIAYVNIVGPFLDYKMPPWSYSYRIYRPIWREENDKEVYWKVGWYRNTSGFLYRKFSQSWPLYRRQIYLTARKMIRPKYSKYIPLNESDNRVLEREKFLSDPKLRLRYLDSKYWKRSYDKVHWASIDLKKFFPYISLQSIKENIKNYLGTKYSQELNDLTEALLSFPLDPSGFNDDELSLIFPKDGKNEYIYNSDKKILKGLPTGLITSGFLSNVAMLKIDSEVEKIIDQYQVAHFRYVDDHTILAPDFNKLINWILSYKELVNKYQPDITLNEEKFEPKELKDYFFEADEYNKKKLKEDAIKKTHLDPRFPTPLMTKTLALVSTINDVEFELLDEKEQEQLLENLELLLLVDIPGHELRVDTRISFAASKIAQLAPIRFPHYSIKKLYYLRHEIEQMEKEREDSKKYRENFKKSSLEYKKINRRLKSLDSCMKPLREKIIKLEKEINSKIQKEKMQTFSLLLKTVNDYPEKLKVWTRLIEFCRKTGFSKLEPIFAKLKWLKDDCIESYYFYKSTLFEIFTNQIFLCLKDIMQESILEERKKASKNFLLKLANSESLYNLYKETEIIKYYEKTSLQIFECALGVAKLVLEKNISRKNFESFCKDISNYKYLDFKKPFEWLKKRKEYDLSAWTWFADQNISKPIQNTPSIIWTETVTKLSIGERLTWSIFKEYPHYLSKENRIFNLFKKGNIILEDEDEGLLYEYIKGLNVEEKEQLKKSNLIIFKNIFINISSNKKNYIDLYEWVDYLDKLRLKNPLDFRLSEWTAINITLKICRLYSTNICNIENRNFINPSNYLIPRSWMIKQLPLEERWTDIISSESKGKIILNEKLLKDTRYTPILINCDNEDKDFAPIRGLGLILLGLILRSYKFPGAWNPKGHRREWEYLVKKLLNSVACSSWTEAIIDSCLLSRSKENLGIREWQSELFSNQDIEDMISFEPPMISNIDDLEKNLSRISKELTKYQIYVKNNLPKQLTPVTIDRLKRNVLFNENGEE